MNLLDENIPRDQRERLRVWRIPARQVGHDLGRRGIKDDNLIPLLLKSPTPAFFTRDLGSYSASLCHAHYCLVTLAVNRDEAAFFIRRFLRHPAFRTKAKRLGNVVRVSHTGILLYRLHDSVATSVDWNA